jgi:hypothetical protein
MTPSGLERVRSQVPPDLWPEIERRLDTGPRRRRWRPAPRLVSVGLAAGLAVAVLVWSIVSLGGLAGSGHRVAAEQRARIAVPEPQPLVAGQGYVWVVGGIDQSNGGLWRIDPATNQATPVPDTGGAWWPAAGEGFAWVTRCHSTAKADCVWADLVKVDPTSTSVVATVRLPGGPFDVVAGLGSVWVSTSKGLVKVDPRTMRITDTIDTPANLLGIAGGHVWATVSGPDGVEAIDPNTDRVTSLVGFQDPCTFTATDQGIYVASCQGGLPPGSPPDQLARLDPATGQILYRVPLDRWGEIAIFDGAPWISSWVGNRVVVQQLDPANGRPTGVETSVRPGPRAWGESSFGPPAVFFQATPDGSFWLTHVDAGDVVRIPIPTGSPLPSRSG